MNSRILAGLLIAVAATSASAATNLLTNGSFEAEGEYAPPPGATYIDPTNIAPTGWALSAGDFIGKIGQYWNAQDGVNSIDLLGNGAPPPAVLSQTVATTIGQQYTLSYYQSYNPDIVYNPAGATTIPGLSVSITGLPTSITTFSNATPTLGTGGNMNWQMFTSVFNATSISTTISFSADAQANNCCFGATLDNVSLTTVTAAVPEPGEWAMMIAGLGAVSLIARRRRASAK